MAPVTSAITRVLVTGFGPFQGVDNNPSWGIASRLPSTLPNNIELHVYPEAIPVAYHPVIDIVPPLIEELQPDLVLSMGVAAGRTYFAVEQTSQRDIYSRVPDVENEVFLNEECDAIWSDQPQKLSTDLDLHAIVADWQNRTAEITWPSSLGAFMSATAVNAESSVEVLLKEDITEPQTEDVRWSDAVGNYLCAFIYYTDMVEMSRVSASGKRDVAFMHVPMLEEDEELDMGTDVAMELLQAMVANWRAQNV